ncbi:MAG: S8 family serine peptidase [Leptolyngbya sp. SIO1E4]|nr:S8 family serine peptidase [Leptolyngbya sp. SIO1E4]
MLDFSELSNSVPFSLTELDSHPTPFSEGIIDERALQLSPVLAPETDTPLAQWIDPEFALPVNEHDSNGENRLVDGQRLDALIGEGTVGVEAPALVPVHSTTPQSQPWVGIIDTGFSADHPDLDYSRLVLGRDWIDGDNNPLVNATEDDHGTAVLGVIAATPNNDIGIDGVSDSAPIWLGRAVGSGDWAASLTEFVDTVHQSGQRNAIANLSFDLVTQHPDGSLTPRQSLTLEELYALEYARQSGVLVVVAAGNNGGLLSALAQTSQHFDNVLTVGAVDGDNRASYSSYGAGLSLLAEGGTPTQPVMTLGNQGVDAAFGTSIAAANVTGAAARIWAENSTLSYRQVIEALTSTATDLHRPGRDNETGVGRVNVAAALEKAAETASEAYDPEPLAIASLTDAKTSGGIHLERALALEIANLTPADGATGINTQTPIRVQFADEAVDKSTLTSDSFRLLDSSGNPVSAAIGADLTGGVISLTPTSPLAPFSEYTLEITSDLLNENGEPATPFTSVFTTGALGSSPTGLSFTKQQLVEGESRFGVSSIAVGPDGNVYASDIGGTILRYNIDPATGLATGTDVVYSQPGAQIAGIIFDPDATATDLKLWFTYAERNNGLFTGTVSRLDVPPSGVAGTATKQDFITGLPHSSGLEHQPNGLNFGADGRLYQAVGGVATLGGTPNWNAEESLLSAAVIVADVKNHAAFQTGPVNVQTVGLDVDDDPTTENYDPDAPDAPVQLYSTGFRNTYDLVWHSNGNLYAGINQNSIGGSVATPESPDGTVPAINFRANEMLVLVQEGNYYGHPNPSRDEYVLNGGNPTAGEDPWEVRRYPVGVQPDADFDPTLIYDVRSVGGNSPNGITEYTGEGPLNGRLLVSFFTSARVIQSFELDENGLVSQTAPLQDPNGENIVFSSPLDVAVHPSGRIYVADFGNRQSDPSNGKVWMLDPVVLPSVIITESDGSTELNEGDTTPDTYTVTLSTEPTAPVTVTLLPDAQLQVEITELTFNASNWNVPQTVSVFAVNDAIAEGTHTGTLTHTVSSNDPDYQGLVVADVVATITEEVVPGLAVTETDGSTRVKEGEGEDSYQIALTAAPTAAVTVTLESDGQTTTSPTELTFTPSNWNQPQTVTVTAVEDTDDEGLHTSQISYTISSDDAQYSGLAVSTTQVEVADNDGPPGVNIVETGTATVVSEGGGTDTYSISLNKAPTADVEITVSLDEQLTFDTASSSSRTLTFTPDNWEVPQIVTVAARDDAQAEGNHTGSISHVVSSSDSDYDGLAIADLSVNITDNDTAGVNLIPSGNSTAVSEAGGSDSYEVVLTSQPTGPVTVTLASDNEIEVSPVSLTFTPENWDIPQTVEVSAVEDSEVEGNHTSVITHQINSDDALYSTLSIDPITVTISDNDGGGRALFIAGSTNLNSSDQALVDELQTLGFEVTVRRDRSSRTSDAEGQDLIVISESVSSGQVGTKFTDVAVPVVVWEAYLFDDFDMTGDTAGTDFGVLSGVTDIDIVDAAHPLSGGLSGLTSVYTSGGAIGFGVPNAEAITVATLPGSSSQYTLFGYESGATLVEGGTAAARRVAGPFQTALSPAGQSLFTAAVTWAIGEATPTPGQLAFTTDSFTLDESGTPVQAVTVSRTGGSVGAVSAELAITFDTASAADVDTAFPLTVSFADGESGSKVIPIAVIDDAIGEGTERFSLSLTSDVAGTLTQATVEILDNDAPGVIQFTTDQYQVQEDGTAVMAVELERIDGSAGAQTVSLSLESGSATPGLDYDDTPVTVTFADGEAGRKTVLIPLVDDAIDEGDETLSLTLASVEGGAALGSTNTATLTIVDDDTRGVQLGQSGGSTAVSEAGDSDSYEVVLTSQPTAPVTVTLASDGEIEVNPISLTFTPDNWETPQVVQVSAVEDSVVEGNHTSVITHQISSDDALYSTLSIDPITVTISDNDGDNNGGGRALFIAGSNTLNSSDQALVDELQTLGFEVTVKRDRSSRTSDAEGQNLIVISESVSSGRVGTKFTDVAVPVVVWEAYLFDDFDMTGDTAGTDFGVLSGVTDIDIVDAAHPLSGGLSGLTSVYTSGGAIGFGIPNAEAITVATLPVSSSQYTLFGYESGATLVGGGTAAARRVAGPFQTALSPAGQSLFTAAVTWAIGEATPTPGQLAFTTDSFTLDESGTPVQAVTVSRTGGSVGAVSAELAITFDTASAADVDTAFPLTVSFADGESGSKVIPIAVVDDAIGEGTERFSLSLVSDVAGTLTQATVEILDNDAPGVIQFTADQYQVQEDGTAVMAVELERIDGSAGAQTATLSFNDGSATAGLDYDDTPVTVTFADGEAGRKTVLIPLVDDAIDEGDETLSLTLASVEGGAALGSTNTATLTIVDDDIHGVQFSQSGGSTAVSEAGDSDSYEVVLTSQPTAPVTVTLASDGEIEVNPVSLTFTPENWDTPQSVQVAAVEDSEVEGNHTSVITHQISSDDSLYSALSIDPITVTISDNDGDNNGGGRALFIAGSNNLNSSDQAVVNRLESQGFEVTVKRDRSSRTSDAEGQDLIVISESVSSGRVGTKFTNVAVPVIVWEAYLFDDLGMTDDTADTDFGVLSGVADIDIVDSAHPLIANLPAGQTPLYQTAGQMSWGLPNDNAVEVATLVGASNQSVIFGYEAGTDLFDGLTAPARRVGFSLMEQPTETGWQLFDAAVEWLKSSQ